MSPRFALKIATDDVTRIDLPQPQQRDAKPATNLLRGKNVLLVEDSLIIALDAEDLLLRLGADKVATEGTEAESALEK